jgi:hypothetical protein
MRSTVSLRLRLLAGGVALATAISLGVWATPAAAAPARTAHPAATSSHHHELSPQTPFSAARPARSASPSIGATLLAWCDFVHPSWCAGTDAPATAKTAVVDIEIAGAVTGIILFVVQVIKGIVYLRGIFRGYKGRHRKSDLIGDCLTQAGGKVVWGKCGSGTTGALATSSLWQEELGANNSIGLVNDYWLTRGKMLWLTAPQPIKANGHLRLHALFGGAGGQTLQEWKKEAA